MISKECFINTISDMKKLDEIENKVSLIYRENGIDCCNTGIRCNYESIILDLLEDAMNDKGEWIAWWIFEMNFGEGVTEDSAQYEDGCPIRLYTAEDLYDFLVLESEK